MNSVYKLNGKPLLSTHQLFPREDSNLLLFVSDTELDLHRSDQASCISRTSVAGGF